MTLKKVSLIAVSLILISCLSGCSSKKPGAAENKEKSISLYVDIKDKHSLDIIKFLTDEYKKENSQVKINVNNVLGSQKSIAEDISKSSPDILITSRNTMIELSRKGILGDMGTFYDKGDIKEKYYSIVSSYGRIEDKYYGVGLIPYSIELFYNNEAMGKLGTPPPSNFQSLLPVLSKLSTSGTRIPVVLTEDMDINSAIISTAASNTVKAQRLESSYQNVNQYNQISGVQEAFDQINSLYKSNIMNKNTFELGNSSTIDNLGKGNIAMVVGISYYTSSLKDKNVDVMQDINLSGLGKSSVPVIINAVLCTPSGGKNQEEAGKFMKFIYSDETQGKLVKKGFVTGNKKANEKLSGMEKKIASHISSAGDDSILLVYNLPAKFQGNISAKVGNILSGNYNKNEWQQTIQESSQ